MLRKNLYEAIGSESTLENEMYFSSWLEFNKKSLQKRIIFNFFLISKIDKLYFKYSVVFLYNFDTL